MKCEKCGFQTNPGDQICINCGAELGINNILIPEVDYTFTNLENKKTEKESSKKFITTCIIGVIIFIIVIISIIFVVIK